MTRIASDRLPAAADAAPRSEMTVDQLIAELIIQRGFGRGTFRVRMSPAGKLQADHYHVGFIAGRSKNVVDVLLLADLE